ncbi:hypothetical protein NDU88_006109 [Pleurodeles waltl]|uniref:Uncharacterized protein n=1 Tax=Pleurodeles waltl TaxID=8319 RepID=A0AAV7ME18_PLEWA|nr:hypothetical protein NDU88_006103 [Pleurodeles waltl]KAJ1101035.1 hypothetical protein NDU88_006109 [Pleurodeles waltl]
MTLCLVGAVPYWKLDLTWQLCKWLLGCGEVEDGCWIEVGLAGGKEDGYWGEAMASLKVSRIKRDSTAFQCGGPHHRTEIEYYALQRLISCQEERCYNAHHHDRLSGRG